jgi:hypothetical protein
LAAARNFLQARPLLIVEFVVRYVDINILEDDREASDPVPLTKSALLSQKIARRAYSSEIALNWPGASTNSLRILLASSITAMKSPTLKPKLIVISSTALSLAQEKVD